MFTLKKKNTDRKLRDSIHSHDFIPLHFQGIQKVPFKSPHSVPSAMLTAKEEMCVNKGINSLLCLLQIITSVDLRNSCSLFLRVWWGRGCTRAGAWAQVCVKAGGPPQVLSLRILCLFPETWSLTGTCGLPVSLG